jgi:CRISPR system Cascade subunit CasE
MTQRHISRVLLKRDAPDVKPLIRTLLPADEAQAISVHHRLLWTLFAEEPGDPAAPLDASDRTSAAFLWRMTARTGQFIVLGPKPRQTSQWFSVESKPFDVQLHAGQHLQFDLRLNATVNRMVDPARGRAGRKRSDVVMDAIHAAERSDATTERAALRRDLARGAVAHWLDRQLQDNGAELLAADDYAGFTLDGYSVLPIGSARGRAGIAQTRGILYVRDPQALRAKMESGFGRAKAWGCGLMLVRPVR